MKQLSAIDQRTLLWALATLTGVLAPHLLRMPVAISIGVLALIAWRLHAGLRGGPRPGRVVKIGLTATGVALVVAHYASVVGPDAGVALLAIMTGLKLLELTTRRDLRVVVFLMYFLILTTFLFTQTVVTLAYLFVAAWATTVLLVAAGRRTGSGVERGDVRTGAALIAQAVPVMLILFFLFPRLPGPLWALPDPEDTARTGLGDEITPGDVSRLSQSDDVAFRVRFEGPEPPPAERYWRGPVFAAYDGETWRRRSPPEQRAEAQVNGPARDYEITLEPHGRRWLLALDLPVRLQGTGARRSAAFEYLADEPVTRTRRYQGRSHPDYRLSPAAGASIQQHYTRLPAGRHPRARELAERLRADSDDPQEMVERTLGWFRERPFTYTLRPGALSGDRVDRFLFDSRRGFCEHFAGAFAVIMRAAGVPARLVGGYLGGEANPGTDYLIIRQADAHAWVEVWLPDQGWRRVDPTAAVAPARVEQGLAAALPADDPVPLMARGDAGGALRQLRLLWDRVDVFWNDWVLAYGPALQQMLWERLGLRSGAAIALALAAALGVTGALLALWAMAGSGARPRDPVLRAWGMIGQRLARAGVPVSATDGPRDLAERAAALRPELAAEIRALARQYIRLRYGERGEPVERREFIRRARRFRPRRPARRR